MASLQTSKTGLRSIYFRDAEGKQRKISLSKMPKSQANSILGKVKNLVWASKTGETPSDVVAQWLREDCSDWLREKLETAGLVQPQADRNATVVEWVDKYIESRKDAKPSTLTVWRHTRRNLAEFFPAKKRLRDVTPRDADEFKLFLKAEEGLARNTVNRRCGFAKQFFRAAVRKGLITSNPFDGVAGTVTGNASRDYFLSPKDAEKILDACPDQQWRVIFALARWGGLRCPSEHLRLRWEDINWADGRFTV